MDRRENSDRRHRHTLFDSTQFLLEIDIKGGGCHFFLKSDKSAPAVNILGGADHNGTVLTSVAS